MFNKLPAVVVSLEKWQPSKEKWEFIKEIPMNENQKNILWQPNIPNAMANKKLEQTIETIF